MKTTSKIIIVVVVVILIIAAVGIYVATLPKAQKEVVIYADYSATLAQPFFNAFTNATGIKVVPVYGAMGDLTGKLIASKGAPSADILFGGAPSSYIAAGTNGIFQSYTPPAISNQSATINGAIWRDQNWTWYPFTYAVLGLSINNKLINTSLQNGLVSWFNLTQPQYKGKLVLENPATSTTTGIAAYSLVYQIYLKNDNGNMTQATKDFTNYMKALVANAVPPYQPDDEHAEVAIGTGTGGITLDWSYIPTLYNQSNGYPLQPKLLNEAVVGPTAMAIINGAPHLSEAQAFVNWVLSVSGQTDIGKYFHKPPIIPGVPIPAGSYSLSTVSAIAFPYSQTFTSEQASNITAIFNAAAS